MCVFPRGAALTGVDVCLRMEALSISLQTVSYSITFSLHHFDCAVRAKSIMAWIACLRCRNTLVAFKLLAPSLEESWNGKEQSKKLLEDHQRVRLCLSVQQRRGLGCGLFLFLASFRDLTTYNYRLDGRK